MFMWCPVIENDSIQVVHQVFLPENGTEATLVKCCTSLKTQVMDTVPKTKTLPVNFTLALFSLFDL
jgi:hypothetical protein